jgi:hypothetical protein
MPTPTRPNSSFLIVLATLLYLGAAITGSFIAVKVDPATGLLALVIVLTTAPIAAVLLARSRRAIAEPPTASPSETSAPRLDELTNQLSALAEQLRWSDDARRILNRHATRDILRQAIEEEIAARDFDAAIVLIDRLAAEQGLRQEAEAFRHRIEQSRSPAREADLHQAILQLDELLAQHRWDVAAADAGRILRLYPESPKAQRLHDRVEQARSAHKVELERRFTAATEQGRLDEAMTTLKQLDEFLTEVEAEPYRELARGIIAQTRDTLGSDFKQAVQERRWTAAADLGSRIIAEFPNTRMAAEVREVIEGIRERIGGG